MHAPLLTAFLYFALNQKAKKTRGSEKTAIIASHASRIIYAIITHQKHKLIAKLPKDVPMAKLVDGLFLDL